MAADALGFEQAATVGGAVVKTYYLPLTKLDATAGPGTGNDDSQGYIAGSVWADRTHHAVYVCVNNATGAAVWNQVPTADANDVELVFSNTSVGVGDTVGNTAIETTFSDKYTVPANTLRAGDCIRITARGVYSTKAATPGTLHLRVYAQAGVTSTLLLDTGAITPTASLTNRGWVLDALLVVQAVGTGGSSAEPIECQGRARLSSGTGTSQDCDMSTAGLSGNTAPIATDLTVNETLYLTAQWQTADTSNTITMRQFIVEHLAAK